MSAGPFGLHAERVADNGFDPLAVTTPDDTWAGADAGKRPIEEGWQHGHPDIALAVCRYRDANLGLLTRRTPFADIDVRHAEIAAAVDVLSVEMLGQGLLRIGAWPKRGRLYRTGVLFPKVTSVGFVLPGDDPEAPGFRPHKIEILSSGQQVVALGRHPSGRDYAWPEQSPLDVHADDLPSIYQGGTRAFVAAAEGLILRLGGAVYRERCDGAGDGDGEAGPSSLGRTAELHRLVAALRTIPIVGFAYDEWVRLSLAFRSGLDPAEEGEGYRAWLDWSLGYPGAETSYLERKWATFTGVRTIGAGSLFYAARAYGRRPAGADARETPPREAARVRRAITRAEVDRIVAALRRIPAGALPPGAWLRIGAALKSSLGEHGFPLWEAWAARHLDYRREALPKKWAGFATDRISAGTIFYLEKRYGR